MKGLLESFAQFFRQNAQAYSAKLEYKESFPHLLLMAFLQRVLNGGGRIHREYALGSKRVDLHVGWQTQNFILELKIKRGSDTLDKGLAQTAQYIDISNPHEAHLLIFDTDSQKSWDEKISYNVVVYEYKEIHVWTM